jgi:hypothetical protein
MPIGGYVTVKPHTRQGGSVKQSKDYRASAHKRKGKKVKQSKLQHNSPYERGDAFVKKHSRYVNNLRYGK